MKTLICSLALWSFALSAWAAHPFQVEDMQRLSRVGSPRVSPDGQWVAFTVTRSDVEKNRSVTNIWRIPAAGGDAQPNYRSTTYSQGGETSRVKSQ